MTDLGGYAEVLVNELLAKLHETIHDAVLSALDDAGLVVPLAFKSKSAPKPESALGATTAGWTKITEASFKSGRVTRTIRANSPVKVKGLGRSGGVGSGFVVTGLETRDDVINVHVRKGREQERTVRLDRIVYVIPRKPSELGLKGSS